MRSVSTPNPHPPPPRWLICEDTLILNSAAESLAPNMCLAEWVLLVRCHLPALPLIHQPELSRLHPWHPRVGFSLFLVLFCFRTISLGGSQSWLWADWEPDARLTQLRPEWGHDRKAPSRVYLLISFLVKGRAYWHKRLERIDVLKKKCCLLESKWKIKYWRIEQVDERIAYRVSRCLELTASSLQLQLYTESNWDEKTTEP